MEGQKESSSNTTPEKPNSYEISVNAKGLWSGKVKVYAETIEEARGAAVYHAEELTKKIKEQNGTGQ